MEMKTLPVIESNDSSSCFLLETSTELEQKVRETKRVMTKVMRRSKLAEDWPSRPSAVDSCHCCYFADKGRKCRDAPTNKFKKAKSLRKKLITANAVRKSIR
jgi:hypothetical protein